MASTTNRNLMKIVIGLLIGCIVFSLLAAMRGSRIYRDGWFIPILVAQLWTAVVGLNRGDYD